MTNRRTLITNEPKANESDADFWKEYLVDETDQSNSGMDRQTLLDEWLKTVTINRETSFGIDDLTLSRSTNACPIKGCKAKPITRYKFLICPEHGLQIHKTTYAYYNGVSTEDKKNACLRNLLPFGREYVAKNILNNSNKAESHRLGSENSEDALTWNIFGGLLHYGRLHHVYNQLTGANAAPNELTLFLWGLEINFNKQRPEPWHRLLEVRGKLEPDIKHFYTEPDIMILGQTHLVCIEAKFTSGNPIAVCGEVTEGEKPKSREGLIERYIRRNNLWKPPVLEADHWGEKIHSQLLRMIVFTSTMAQMEGCKDWIVANLVSKTQWKKRNTKSKSYDFDDPTFSIPANVRHNFKFISWEDEIYEKVLKHDSVLSELSGYMKKKTANLEMAFEI